MLKYEKRAFTLVELVIVIAVILILATTGISFVSGTVGKSKRATDENNARSIENAIKMACIYNESENSGTIDIRKALELYCVDAEKVLNIKQSGYAFYFDNTTKTVKAKQTAGTHDILLLSNGSNPILSDGTVGEGAQEKPESSEPFSHTMSDESRFAPATQTNSTPAAEEPNSEPPPAPELILASENIALYTDSFAYFDITLSMDDYSEKGEIGFKSGEFVYIAPDNQNYIITWHSSDIDVVSVSFRQKRENVLTLKLQSGHAGSCTITFALKTAATGEQIARRELIAGVSNY